MPSRLDEYEEIISQTLKRGYTHISIKDYIANISTGGFKNNHYFLNRHDIDTDLNTAKKFFEIEKKYGVKATYYFRLSTLDIKFMQEINSYGSEVGYHFEEIASYCKVNKIRSKKQIESHFQAIKSQFKKNFKFIEEKCGFKITTVCSHGDFINRKLHIVNSEITNDNNIRKELGIIAEGYDKILIDNFDIYISDRPYPVYYHPKNIFECISEHKSIYLLTHPRQWQSNVIINTKENLKRLYEGIKWQIL